MTDTKVILDQILRPLADGYESDKLNHWVTLNPGCPEEFEPLRETLAALRTERSITRSPLGDYRLTAEGYERYRGKLDVLRTLPF
jgi:hypothetical protein